MPESLQPDVAPPAARLFRLRGLHIAVILAIAVSALTRLAQGLYPLLNSTSHPRVLAGDSTYATLTSMGRTVFYVAGILFVIWLWRARKNLDTLTGPTDTLGAGWAIGGWFVPLANLYIPYRLLAHVTRNSSTSKMTNWLVHGWWAGILAQVLCLIAIAATDNWIPIAATAAIIWVIAGGLLAAIVIAVTTGQHSKMDTAYS